MIYLKNTNQIGRGANIILLVIVHPCAKFEVIWTMLGELLVHKCSSDVHMIISHIYLNFESGLV